MAQVCAHWLTALLLSRRNYNEGFGKEKLTTEWAHKAKGEGEKAEGDA